MQLDSTNIKGHGRNLTTLTRRHRPDECGSFGGSFLQVSELLIGGREYRKGKRKEEALRASSFLRFLDAGTSSSVESSLPRCTRVRRLPDQFARCALKVPMNASESSACVRATFPLASGAFFPVLGPSCTDISLLRRPQLDLESLERASLQGRAISHNSRSAMITIT